MGSALLKGRSAASGLCLHTRRGALPVHDPAISDGTSRLILSEFVLSTCLCSGDLGAGSMQGIYRELCSSQSWGQRTQQTKDTSAAEEQSRPGETLPGRSGREAGPPGGEGWVIEGSGSEGAGPGQILRVWGGGVSGKEGSVCQPEPGDNLTSVSGRSFWVCCGE